MVDERQKIEDRIRKKRAEIVALEEKVKAAKVYLGALQDIVKLLGDEQEQDAPSPEAKLRPGSSVARTRDLILEEEGPLHIDALLKGMGKAVTAAERASLAGSLAAYVRRNEIFTRPAPNTFGLLELGHTEIAEEDEDEPPAGFGRASVGAAFDRDLDEDVPF